MPSVFTTSIHAQFATACCCSLQAAILSSAEFICLDVAYREAFWEELSRHIWRGRSIRRPLVVVFKVSCFPFVNCFASFLLDIIFFPALPSRTVYSLLLHLDPREKISSPIQDLFCSHEPLTYPGSASVNCTGELSIRFCKYSPFLPKRVKVIGLYCYHVNSDLSNEYKFLYVSRWISSEKNDVA